MLVLFICMLAVIFEAFKVLDLIFRFYLHTIVRFYAVGSGRGSGSGRGWQRASNPPTPKCDQQDLTVNHAISSRSHRTKYALFTALLILLFTII